MSAAACITCYERAKGYALGIRLTLEVANQPRSTLEHFISAFTPFLNLACRRRSAAGPGRRNSCGQRWRC
jgi:hypothetical protein